MRIEREDREGGREGGRERREGREGGREKRERKGERERVGGGGGKNYMYLQL